MREILPPELVPRLDDEQAAVVAWLRSPEGEAWTRARIGLCGRLHSHRGTVYLAELIPQSGGRHVARMQPPEGPGDGLPDRLDRLPDRLDRLPDRFIDGGAG